MSRSILVVGHADADGHLIAEQVRRNLDLVGGFDVDVVVDPDRTKDHRSWMRLDQINEIESADLVFFVDLMFAPKSFSEEASALVSFVRNNPGKRFFLIDHHPLPLRRLSGAENLRVLYRPEVFDCTFGPRSGMMVVAAICEKQGQRVSDIKAPIHETLAIGVRRAAALGGDLPGEKLLALLRADRWDALLQLAEDSPEHHRLPRGRRISSQQPSKALRILSDTAEELLKSSYEEAAGRNDLHRRVGDMATNIAMERYAYDDARQGRVNAPAPTKDLEAIVTLLEVAALSLTTEPNATFTLDELIKEARSIGGDEISLDDRDVHIVMEKATFVEKAGIGLRVR